MAFLDFLVDEDSVREQQRLADKAAKERFDPSDLMPQLTQSMEVAQEGIADEEIRKQLISRIFSQGMEDNITELSGGSQARALAFAQRMQQERQSNLAEAETQLSLKEEQAKRAGEQAVAETRSKQEQIRSQREARIEENRLQAEAEIERRKKQLGATVGKLFGTVAGSFLGPAGAAAGGALGGALAGGSGAVAGGVSGATTSLGRQMSSDEISENFSIQDFVGNMLERNARASVENPMPEDEIIPANLPSVEELQNFDTGVNNQPMGGVSQSDLDFMQQLYNNNQFAF